MTFLTINMLAIITMIYAYIMMSITNMRISAAHNYR
jgi:hypothetical protein